MKCKKTPLKRKTVSKSFMLYPRAVHLVHTATDKATLRAKQEANDICRLLSRTLALESRRLIKGRILGSAGKVPVLLHERCVNGTRGDTVDADFTVAVFQGGGFCEANHAMLASIVGAVSGKACDRVC